MFDLQAQFIFENFKKIKNPSIKIIFDIANFNKNAKKYKEAIKYYDQIISKIDINSQVYAEILYRRGACYERLGDYVSSDKDLLKSLEVNPDDAYVLNYLAYYALRIGGFVAWRGHRKTNADWKKDV